MRLWPRRRSIVVNPVGWDEQHQRTHDVGFQIDGSLMHYGTCWCRRPCLGHAERTDASGPYPISTSTEETP